MKNPITLVVVLIVLGFVGFQSVFVVHEGQRALLTRFDKVVRNGEGQISLYEPGASFKIPFVDKPLYVDARIQTLNSTADRFVTTEKKDLIIDSYVKWRVVDFAKFYTSTQGKLAVTEARLKDRVADSLRSQIAKLTIREIVAGKDGRDNEDSAEKTSSKREQIMQNTMAVVGPETEKDLGIKIVDVRIMKVELPDEVSNSIYQRMRAERDTVARLHRSEGRQEAEAIRAKADKQAMVKVAEAERQAEEIRGKGDAAATKIYAQAYSKNPEFFDFLRSMDAYSHSMSNGGNVIVTDNNNEFLKYFK